MGLASGINRNKQGVNLVIKKADHKLTSKCIKVGLLYSGRIKSISQHTFIDVAYL